MTRFPFFWGLHVWLWLFALVSAMVSWSCAFDKPVRASREFSLSTPAEAVSKLDVRSRVGAIHVTGYDGTDVQVRVRVKVRAASDERAEALAEKVTLRPVTEGSTLKLSPDLPHLKFREQIEVELDISVPWCQVVSSGTEAASQPAPDRTLVCHTAVGRIRVCDLAAAVHAEATTGAVTVENVSGPVDADTQTGAVDVDQVDGKVTATSSTGAITVTHVRGPVRAKASTGAIDIRDVNCPQADDSEMPAVSAKASTGTVRVRDVTGDVEASTSVGKVTVTDVRGAVDAHSSIGKVVVKHVEEPVGSD